MRVELNGSVHYRAVDVMRAHARTRSALARACCAHHIRMQTHNVYLHARETKERKARICAIACACSCEFEDVAEDCVPQCNHWIRAARVKACATAPIQLGPYAETATADLVSRAIASAARAADAARGQLVFRAHRRAASAQTALCKGMIATSETQFWNPSTCQIEKKK